MCIGVAVVIIMGVIVESGGEQELLAMHSREGVYFHSSMMKAKKEEQNE